MKQYQVFIPHGTDSGEWVTLKGQPLDIPNSAGLKPIICTLKIGAFREKNEYRYRLFDEVSGISLCLPFRKETTEGAIKDIAYKIKTHLKTPEALRLIVSDYAEKMDGYKNKPCKQNTP